MWSKCNLCRQSITAKAARKSSRWLHKSKDEFFCVKVYMGGSLFAMLECSSFCQKRNKAEHCYYAHGWRKLLKCCRNTLSSLRVYSVCLFGWLCFIFLHRQTLHLFNELGRVGLGTLSCKNGNAKEDSIRIKKWNTIFG